MIQAKLRSPPPPAATKYLEAFGVRLPADDFERHVGLVLCPGDEPSRVSTVREGALDKGIAGAGGFQHELAAVAILDRGGVDDDREQAAVGVGQDVAFAAVDLLARVVTL